MTIRSLCRSVLYSPGSNPVALQKALRSGADVLIFDLEDAVAPDSKETARDHIAAALSQRDAAAPTVVVRVNALSTPWCEDDVSTLGRLTPAAILFPKINTPADVELAQSMMAFHGVSRETQLWCMIESPLAVLNASAIGQLAGKPNSRMTTWVIGTNDLVKDMRARHTALREALVPALITAIMAARAHGICVLDGVHNDIRDTEGFHATCEQGRSLGFDGRTLIHPSQIDGCNRVYSPTPEEVEDAKAVVQAFAAPENKRAGVLRVNGRMVELLHAEVARDTLAIAQTIATRAGASPHVT